MAKRKPNNQKKTDRSMILVTAAVVCAALIALVWNKNSNRNGTDAGSQNNTDAAPRQETQVIEAGGNLVIPVDEVTETAQFFPAEVDGTEMEIIAVRDSDGNIRTAFNTCQVCYSSGRGYYVQQGDYLICQNCGNRFTVEQIETSSGGCNPYPIFEENKLVSEDSVVISYDYLKEAIGIFANWKI